MSTWKESLVLGLTPARLYVYGAVILVTLGMVLTIKVLNARLKHAKAENVELVTQRDQAKADFAAYKAAAEHDARLNKETRDVLQTRLHDIESERSKPAPRLRCYASSVPSAGTSSGTAAGVDEQAGGPVDSADAFDPVGPALDYAADAARCEATLTGLQEWERARR